MDTVNLPDDTQAEIMRIVATELDEIRTHAVDPVDALTAAAYGYLTLRAHLWHGMGDIADAIAPCDDGDTYPFATAREVRQLTAYIHHMAEADFATCDVCDRTVTARHRYVELPGRGNLWQRLRWAATDAYLVLRHGTWRIAHTPRCRP